MGQSRWLRGAQFGLVLLLAATFVGCGYKKPTAAEATRGAQEFLEAIPFNRTVVDGSLESIIRQSTARGPASSIKEPSPTNSAESQRIYVVLDLHAAPGGQSNFFVAGPGPQQLWQAADLRQKTVALWRSIAARYAARTIIAGYDLLNEPAPPSGAELVSIYREIIAAIREVDTQHLLFLEGSNFAKDFSMFQGSLDANSAYSFHMYTWFGEDANQLVGEWAAISQRDNLPMWCGEFGENQTDAVRASLDAIDAPANQMAGWTFWTWKKATPAKYPALVGIKVTPDWNKVIRWISAP